jgi:LPS export ABC transporter permease LptG
MRIVTRYLLWEFALASCVVGIALVATVLAADALLHIDHLGDDPAQGLRDLALRALDLPGLALPLACSIGATWSLTSAARHREITAIRCSGIPLKGALLPLLVASLLGAAAFGWLEDRTLVPARASLLELDPDGQGSPTHPRFSNGRYWSATGDSIFSATEYHPAQDELVGVTVFELSSTREIRRRIDAARARYRSGSRWEFIDATVREFDVGSLRPQHVASLEIDLGVSSADLRRALPPPEATTLHRLARQMRESSGEDAARAEVAFHARLAQSLAILVLVLFAIPFSTGDVERGDSLARALLFSLCAAALYWLAWTLALLAAQGGVVPAGIALWAVTAAALALGSWRFRAIPE